MKKNAKKTTKQPAARSRDALVAHLRPLVETFVEGLVDIAWTQVSGKLDRAMEAARDSLAEDDVPVEVEPARDAMGNTYPSPIPVTIEQAASTPPRVRACSACGKPGHRRPTCPALAPSAPVVVEPQDDDEDEDDELPSAPVRPALDRAQRYADIEESKRRREAASR